MGTGDLAVQQTGNKGMSTARIRLKEHSKSSIRSGRQSLSDPTGLAFGRLDGVSDYSLHMLKATCASTTITP